MPVYQYGFPIIFYTGHFQNTDLRDNGKKLRVKKRAEINLSASCAMFSNELNINYSDRKSFVDYNAIIIMAS